jgi:hypothetical protein
LVDNVGRYSPTNDEERVGIAASHCSYVSGQAFCSVEPADGNHFKEGDEHQRNATRIRVDELEVVDASLTDVRDPQKERNHTYSQYHEFLSSKEPCQKRSELQHEIRITKRNRGNQNS